MEAMGWEIKPAGWILSFIVIILLGCCIIGWPQHRSDQNQ